MTTQKTEVQEYMNQFLSSVEIVICLFIALLLIDTASP